MDSTGAGEYELWLSDKRENNFRYKLTNTYKANRTKPLPIHYGAVRQYLEKEWSAQVTPGQEADDALGIRQGTDTIICTIDKDLKQVAGLHYNWVRKEFDEITEQQGIAHFYQQLLTGDKVDNIISPCYRMGDGTAASLLAYCESEEDMLEVVQGHYNDDSLLNLNGDLLWIRKANRLTWKK